MGHSEVDGFIGLLRGGGYEVKCTGFATLVRLPGTTVTAHANYMIATGGEGLPDGDYDLIAHGNTIALRRTDGSWLAR